jgi:hypothetical protein
MSRNKKLRSLYSFSNSFKVIQSGRLQLIGRVDQKGTIEINLCRIGNLRAEDLQQQQQQQQQQQNK